MRRKKSFLVCSVLLFMLFLCSTVSGCYKDVADTRDYCCMAYFICFSCELCTTDELHEIAQKRDQGNLAWCRDRLELYEGCEQYSLEDAELACE